MSAKQQIALLKKALKEEKKRSASFSMRLKKSQKEAKKQNPPMNDENLEEQQWEESVNSPEENFEMDSTELTNDGQIRLTDASFRMSMNNLSFASLNIPECKPIEGEEDVDRRSFEQWKDLLEASMQLVGVTDEYTKIRLLKIKAGPKLLSVLESTNSPADAPNRETHPYSNAIIRLQNFFGSRDYRLMQRQKLRSMTQNTGENDMKYVKRIIAAAKLCDFNEEQLLENVAYVIQSHAFNSKIREISRKILRKGSSVANLLDKVQACELERIHEDVYQQNHLQQRNNIVAAVTCEQQGGNENQQGSIYHVMRNANYPQRNVNPRQQAFGRWQPNRGRGALNRRGFERRSTTNNRSTCWRCTSPFHTETHCYATEKICRNCQQKGHIERACTEVQSSSTSRRQNNVVVDEPPVKVRKVAAITNGEIKDEESRPVSMPSSHLDD